MTRLLENLLNELSLYSDENKEIRPLGKERIQHFLQISRRSPSRFDNPKFDFFKLYAKWLNPCEQIFLNVSLFNAEYS
ncbi:13454_t:CDS:2 [Ambispora gerdemannii]|uniref:13454_t:CDS:1 n=1 Tax=Ambispora gerdemannii TaxID=144530 RepID=A0A9N8YVN0_9GLOM|nr:13454_t:CDS:2 [Ambispora gerdemannii]